MNRMELKAPVSWSELTQEQLAFLLKTVEYVNRVSSIRKYSSMEDYAAQSLAQVAVICLFRWNGVEIITPFGDGWLVKHDKRELKITASTLAAATGLLSWMSELPDSPVRLGKIDGASAVDASLDHDFSFDDYLTCETLWQVYQSSQSGEYLTRMAETLYHKPGIKLKEYEILSIFYWWASLKVELSRLYPNFLKPAQSETVAEPTPELLRRNMDSQIRALTKGDVTKEETVLSLPVHRALTELDAIAREYDDLNSKFPSK